MVTIRDMRGKIPEADKKEQVHLELTQQLLGIWAGGEDDENDLLALLSHVEANRP
ncbi:hypothetical protein FS749_012648 [Ceratobasidium sp. UAMH 11750]|nr:hypothetical protein FS749_012648 [Ceratobasidium sp. UAMH 11750]